MKQHETLKPEQRKYLPNEFKLTVWSKVRPYFNELLRRKIESVEDLEIWILNCNELIIVIHEEFEMRYNDHFIENTECQRSAELYEYAIQELAPKIIPFEKRLNEKFLNCEFNQLISEEKKLHLKILEKYR